MSKLHSVVVYDALSRAIEGLGGTIGRREEEDIVRMKILRPEAACELFLRSPPRRSSGISPKPRALGDPPAAILLAWGIDGETASYVTGAFEVSDHRHHGTHMQILVRSC